MTLGDSEIRYDKEEVRKWQTKDSGARAQYETGMVRDTEEGKARFDLLLPKDIPYHDQMLTRFADLLARGAEKYTERNWEQAGTQEELNRYYSSAYRHFMQWITGETDEDHAAAVFFNIQAAEYVKYKLNDEVAKTDDHVELNVKSNRNGPPGIQWEVNPHLLAYPEEINTEEVNDR